jgi:TolB protein
MTLTAPHSSDPVDRDELEALIEEARRRARRRRRIYGAVAALGALAGLAVFMVVERGASSQGASPALATQVELLAGAANSKIAFLRDPDGDGLFGGDIELWVMNPDGSGQRRLTRKASDSFAPVWSPDGRRIAFVRRRLGAPLPRGGRATNQDIYVINADGSGERRLTSGPVQSIFPAWSPDGRKIAFTRATPRRTLGVRKLQTDIYVMNADGSGQRRLTRALRVTWWPVWSPDGREIAFTSGRFGNSDIHVMNADRSGLRQLTQNPGNYFAPASSPDGSKITFTGAADTVSAAQEPLWEIYVVNADGSGQRKLDPGGRGAWASAVWSPDGGKIAYQRHGLYLMNAEVYVMNADGTGQRKLALGGSPIWSPDGRQILFTRFVGHVSAAVRAHGGDAEGNDEIFVANVDGSGQRRLTRNPGDDVGAAWSAQRRR